MRVKQHLAPITSTKSKKTHFTWTFICPSHLNNSAISSQSYAAHATKGIYISIISWDNKQTIILTNYLLNYLKYLWKNAFEVAWIMIIAMVVLLTEISMDKMLQLSFLGISKDFTSTDNHNLYSKLYKKKHGLKGVHAFFYWVSLTMSSTEYICQWIYSSSILRI